MSEINFRIVARVIGILLCFEALFMLLPLSVAIYYNESDIYAFLLTIGITAIVGLCSTFIFKRHSKQMGKREGFLIVSTSWIFFSLFGMLPFLIHGDIDNITDAFFETMSGCTTTGATILDDIESLPHGILFWRSLMQWLGGMGIILFTLAVLPMLNSGGGIQLFNAEVPGITHDKLRPRISETTKRLWIVYLSITVLLIVLLVLGPMNFFDAVCHALTTTATGGYSTKQNSIAYWDSAYIEYVIIIFMLISGINFSLVYHAALGDYKKLLQDEETKWFLFVVLLATAAIAAGLFISGQIYGNAEKTIRTALFQVSTCITTTGFATADFAKWGPFFNVVIFCVMFFGACAGSTSGGAKTIRMVVVLKNTANEFYRHLHPNAVVPVRINRRVISYDLVSKILAFLFVYVLVVAISALVLSSLGLSFEESFGCTLSCLSNVGPGFGRMSSDFSFEIIPTLGKWVLSFDMLIGRLELFTVLILFSPYFWKKS